MRIKYASSVMRDRDFLDLFPDRTKMPGQQAQKFHRLVIEGLAANGCHVDVITAAPVTPRNYPRKIYPGGFVKSDTVSYRYLKIVNLPLIKNLCQVLGGFFRVLAGGRKDTAVVCDVLQATVSLGAVLAGRLLGRPCVGIVTDLPDMMVTTAPNRSYTRLVEMALKHCTHYVLLTEQMKDALGIGEKPYVVIEGLCDSSMGETVRPAPEDPVRRCIYAGLLDARYGVKTMVEAFLLADVPDSRLEVYGGGPYAEELAQVAASAENILFHGQVPVDEVVKAELKATLLINPRPTDEEFTKYSFPSKNMEYMVSGTPVLTTKLAGMPKEYEDHVYFFEEETVEAMAKCLRRVLALDGAELDAKGAGAKAFVLEHKNDAVQAGKIIQMIEERK